MSAKSSMGGAISSLTLMINISSAGTLFSNALYASELLDKSYRHAPLLLDISIVPYVPVLLLILHVNTAPISISDASVVPTQYVDEFVRSIDCVSDIVGGLFTVVINEYSALAENPVGIVVNDDA